MNKYILANSISPTNDILTEDIIKSMTWLGLSTESTSEDIISLGYILLPEFNTEPTDTEVSVASKDEAGNWSLSNIPFAEWSRILRERKLSILYRVQRNKLLAQSDWSQAYDVPTATKEAWAGYRQALRDLPAQPGFPNFVTWPTKPQ